MKIIRFRPYDIGYIGCELWQTYHGNDAAIPGGLEGEVPAVRGQQARHPSHRLRTRQTHLAPSAITHHRCLFRDWDNNQRLRV